MLKFALLNSNLSTSLTAPPFLIATYITFQSAKAVLLRKLNTIQSIGSFLRTKNGYKVTNPEGYVAIQKGGAVKLVDRLEFSQANFNMAKDWVKG